MTLEHRALRRRLDAGPGEGSGKKVEQIEAVAGRELTVEVDFVEVSEVAGFEVGFGAEDAGISAAVVGHAEKAVGFARGTDHVVAGGGVGGHGFFHEDVFAGAKGGEGLRCVKIGRGCDVDGVDFRVGQKFIQRGGVAGGAMAAGKTLSPGGIAAVDGHELMPRQLPEGRTGFFFADITGPDEAPADERRGVHERWIGGGGGGVKGEGGGFPKDSLDRSAGEPIGCGIVATEFQHYSDTWHGGFPLLPPLAQRTGDPVRVRMFSTTATLGGLQAKGAGLTPWQMSPGLPPGMEIETVHLLNSGYRMTTRSGGDLIWVCLRAGVCVGEFPESAVPELFCPSREVADEASRSRIVLDEGEVLLEHRVVEGRRRMVLLSGSDAEALRIEARTLLETAAAREAWAPLWRERMARLARLGAETRPVQFDLALETLEAAVEPSAGGFRGLWLRDPQTDGLSLNGLPGLLPALARMEPAWADGLLKTLTDLPRLASGAFAATVRRGGQPDAAPAWPVLAQAVLLAKQAGWAGELPEALLQALKAHVRSYGDAVPPLWPDLEAGLTPEVADTGLNLVDLPAMLVAEIDALAALGAEIAELKAQREALRSWVLENAWQPNRGVFLDVLENGERVKRMTAGGLMPLLWRDLPAEKARGVYRMLSGGDGLRDTGGLRQWEPRAEDPVAPPVRLELQHLLLHHLLKEAPRDVGALMGGAWAAGLDRAARQPLGFVMETEAGSLAWHPLAAAFSLRFAPLQSKVDLELSTYPRWVRFMERHRQGIVGIAAAVMILIPATVGLHYATRDDFGLRRELEEAGHAETLMGLQRWTEAEAVFTRLLERSRPSPRHLDYLTRRGRLRLQLREYAAAAEDLRRVVAEDEDLLRPEAFWNLAQAQWRLGDLEGARETLLEFREIFAEGYPELDQRAAVALNLLAAGHRIPPGQ